MFTKDYARILCMVHKGVWRRKVVERRMGAVFRPFLFSGYIGKGTPNYSRKVNLYRDQSFEMS